MPQRILSEMARTSASVERERGVCCEVPLSMPADRAAELADVLKALADPTRVRIMVALREAKQPLCTCDFTAAVDLTQPTVTHHMGKLREAGLIDATRSGIWTYYRLRPHLPASVRKIVEALV